MREEHPAIAHTTKRNSKLPVVWHLQLLELITRTGNHFFPMSQERDKEVLDQSLNTLATPFEYIQQSLSPKVFLVRAPHIGSSTLTPNRRCRLQCYQGTLPLGRSVTLVHHGKLSSRCSQIDVPRLTQNPKSPISSTRMLILVSSLCHQRRHEEQPLVSPQSMSYMKHFIWQRFHSQFPQYYLSQGI